VFCSEIDILMPGYTHLQVRDSFHILSEIFDCFEIVTSCPVPRLIVFNCRFFACCFFFQACSTYQMESLALEVLFNKFYDEVGTDG